MSTKKVYVGMDVHKDSVMAAVLAEDGAAPTVVKRLPNEERKLKRFLDRRGRDGTVRCCYEASGAGYVLERAIRSWRHGCEIVAPSLIPQRPGERRKHDRKDATALARLYSAGELVTIRVPTEREERVRDVVRCGETFQREILKSRHYILKFLARRGLVYREGQNWTGKHLAWLGTIRSGAVLEAEDHRGGVSISRRVHHTAERDARRLGGGHKPHRDRKNMRHIPRHGPRDGTCGYRGGSEVLVNVRGWSMLPR